MTKKPIQKEEEYFDKQPEGDEKCRCGHIVKECYYNQISGEKHQRKEGEPLCSHCYNFSTPSDTFIEGIIKKFREQFVASDNRFLTGTETVGNAEKFIRQSFKSSLEEIEEKILELIAYSSFDVSYYGDVSERNCTVEEAMSELSKDVEQLFKNVN